jgi:hypothetical protein
MQWQEHTKCSNLSLPNPTKATNAIEGYERKNKEEIHKELQDIDPTGSPHIEETVICGNEDLDLLSLFPQKDGRNMGGMEEGGQAIKINNGGERSPKTWLAQGGRSIYRWGKSGSWKMLGTTFSRKSDGVGFQAGLSGGQSDGAKKLLNNVVRRAAGFSGLGPNSSAMKKHQHKNGDNFYIRIPFLMNLGSLESPQRDLQLNP